MGNSNSRNNNEVDPSNNHDDFEPIDKPASPTFMTSFQKLNNPNDLTTSGVLVDISDDEQQTLVATSKRRSKTVSTTPAEKKERHHHEHDIVPLTQQSDTELLQESLTKDKQERLQKLHSDQKNRRSKAVEERRKGTPSPSEVQPNPFSRFLSVFSVEPQFPSHKRRYEPSESEIGEIEEEPKRPKLDPSRDEPNRSIILDWLDAHLPIGWPWIAAATTTAVVAFLLTSTSTTKLSPKPKATTIW